MAEYLFKPTDAVKEDLQRLNRAAIKDPAGPEKRLLIAAMNQMERIKQQGTSTKELVLQPGYGDLSDCQSNYVGLPDAKPSHRIVWREIPPTQRGEPITREIIAFGKRDRGEVYDIAAERLNRPIGVSLDQLNKTPDPTAPQRTAAPRIAPSADEPQHQEEPQLG